MHYLLTLFLLLFSHNVMACLVKTGPKNAEDVPNIIIGRVTGIHLTQTESEYTKGSMTFSDLTEAHTIRVKVDQWLKGKRTKTQIMELKIDTGCGILIPQVLDSGLFFIAKDGISAIPIYTKEGNAYAYWAYKLGLVKD